MQSLANPVVLLILMREMRRYLDKKNDIYASLERPRNNKKAQQLTTSIAQTTTISSTVNNNGPS